MLYILPGGVFHLRLHYSIYIYIYMYVYMIIYISIELLTSLILEKIILMWELLLFPLKFREKVCDILEYCGICCYDVSELMLL